MSQSRDSGISSRNGRRIFKSKDLKVNIGKTKEIVGGSISRMACLNVKFSVK